MHIQIWGEAVDRGETLDDFDRIGAELEALSDAMEIAWPNSRWLPRKDSRIIYHDKHVSTWEGKWEVFNLVLRFDPADPSWTLLVVGSNGWALKSWQAVKYGNGESALPAVVKESRRVVGWWLQNLATELLDVE